jgi:hypothetical protein
VKTPQWQHVPAKDLFLYAHSFHKAAKTLAASFQPEANALGDFLPAVCPVIFMYRHAVELHLKVIVLADGGNFLAPKPDPISICTSHSVSWLAQFVCRIVTALHWEQEFRCEGIETLADFRAVVEEVNSVDPGSYNFRCPVDSRSQSSVRDFGKKMDTVIGLLESTADALAAEWDLRSEAPGVDEGWNGGGFGPAIQ